MAGGVPRRHERRRELNADRQNHRTLGLAQVILERMRIVIVVVILS